MRVAFFGNPGFALGILKGIEGVHDIKLVVCSEDKRAGRGNKLSFCEVKEHALARGYEIAQPSKLDKGFADYLRSLDIDVAVVAAYGKLIPDFILGIPKYDFINVHGSILPRWRGAAPIQRAIIEGDEYSGVSIMKMVKELDAGGVYQEERILLDERETASSLSDKLIKIGVSNLLEVMDKLENSDIKPMEQSGEGITYAKKISKNEGLLDYNKSPEELDNLIRGLYPYPAAKTYYKGELWKIYEAAFIEDEASMRDAGMIVSADSEGIKVACNGGYIVFESLQRAGGKRMFAADFVKGHRIEISAVLSSEVGK